MKRLKSCKFVTPASTPATVVTPDLEVPGINLRLEQNHDDEFFQDIFSTALSATLLFFSQQRSLIFPIIKEIAIDVALNLSSMIDSKVGPLYPWYTCMLP